MEANIPNSKKYSLEHPVKLFLLLSFVFLLNACDDSNSASIRAINLSPDVGEIDVFSDDELLFRAIGYGNESDYNSLSTDGSSNSRQFRISPTDSFAVLSEQRRSLKTDKEYSLFLFDFGDNATSILEQDDNSKASGNRLKLRFVHGAPSVKSVDVYVENIRIPSQDRFPTLAGQSFKRISKYLESDGGEYRIRITEKGSTTTIAESLPFELKGGDVYTVALIDRFGGGLPLGFSLFRDSR